MRNGIELVKSYEGLQLKAYLCPANVWTIGYGNTFYEDGTKVQEGDVITRERAEELLEFVYDKFEFEVVEMVKVPITENQLGALVSFAFNLGSGALKKSTLLKLVNVQDFSGAADEFLKWTRAGGKVLNGLVRRRSAERDLFLSN